MHDTVPCYELLNPSFGFFSYVIFSIAGSIPSRLESKIGCNSVSSRSSHESNYSVCDLDSAQVRILSEESMAAEIILFSSFNLQTKSNFPGAKHHRSRMRWTSSHSVQDILKKLRIEIGRLVLFAYALRYFVCSLCV